MAKAVIYTRVSSDEQINGMSLEFQKKDCLEYARQRGFEVAEIFEERGESAKFFDRPQLLRALEYCQKHKNEIDHFIVWKLDRFARMQADHFKAKERLVDCKIKLHSATELSMTNGDELSNFIFESVTSMTAQLDNTVRSQRTRRGILAKLEQGIAPWRPPIGYAMQRCKKRGEKKNAADPPDPVFFPIIQAALKEYATGMYARSELIVLLDKHGLAQARKMKTRKQFVHQMLFNYLDYYAGIIVHRKDNKRYTGQHIPMITQEEYETIIAIRDGKESYTRTKKDYLNPQFPLRRTVRCASCNEYLTGSASKGRKCYYSYYRCYTVGCPAYGKSISKDMLESDFSSLIRKELSSRLTASYIDALFSYLKTEFGKRNANRGQRIVVIKRNLESLNIRREKIFQMHEDGVYSQEDFQERKTAVEIEIQKEKARLDEISSTNDQWMIHLDTAQKNLMSFGIVWKEMEFQLQRRFQQFFFPDGISYDRETKFGTANLPLILDKKPPFGGSKSGMVSLDGRDWNQIEAEIIRIANMERVKISLNKADKSAGSARHQPPKP